MEKSKSTIQDVHNFWNNNFLYSFELQEDPGTKEFFETINKLKFTDIEKFSHQFWEFDKHSGEKVLDVGCGPGWLVRNFAENNSDTYAVDIADIAVELTGKMLQIYNLKADLYVASAEKLPFEDNIFDYITSSGVIHHTPDIQQAADEIYRVLKPGKTASISIYYKNILLNKTLFPILVNFYRILTPNVPGRAKLFQTNDVDNFIRMYDGDENPVGYGLTYDECLKLFSKFDILGHELHFFPKRFMPLLKNMPDPFYKIFDKYFGTMIYFKLKKPEE